MPTLCVLRHAKSDQYPGPADHDRPLAPRGRADAPLVGRWLREQGHHPALVLCSSARRTVETLEALGLGEAEIEISPEFYLATARTWIERLRLVAPGRGPVLVLGHNPGLQQLVVDLGGSRAARQLAGGFPTAAVAVLEFGGPWSDLDRGRAHLAAFVRPRELP